MFTWRQLAMMPENVLSTIDIALVNLACAADLPGTENWDPQTCVRRLDEWAESVRIYTDQKLFLFAREPKKYNNSSAYFRALALITVLERDCGVRYNPAKMAEDAPFDAADTFIYGVIFGHGGTCASLPVVYVAVGRRLGYPLKLVSATATAKDAGHLFARWDGAGERFNIEATSRGLSCFNDDYYRTGRFAISREDEARGGFLRSKAPREELADFLAARSACWTDHNRHRQAAEAVAWASAVTPGNAFYRGRFNTMYNVWLRALRRREPPGFPELLIKLPTRRFPPDFPLDIARNLVGLEAKEDLLSNLEFEQKYWSPLRNGSQLPGSPVNALVDLTPQGWSVRLEPIAAKNSPCSA